jgi:superfamily II DNA or RNA helicase
MIFCTFQTAILKNLESKLAHVDIIVIDEAHNVSLEGEYRDLIQSLCDK